MIASADPSPISTGIALFDLDHTLLGGDATYEWMQFLMRRGIIERASYEARLKRFYDDYDQGTLDIHAFLRFDFEPLARHPRARLEAWRTEYLAESIAPLLLPKAHALIASHAARGHLTAIVTAANRFITTPIAERYGVEHLLASEPEARADGEFTGEVAGIPCFHEGKVIRLDAWLAGRGQALADFAESYFYGDSQSDVPLLEKVTHPVVVHPDPALAALADSRGWRVISLR
jgi:HAD superfamily hydrolase (TIGR01490 family)